MISVISIVAIISIILIAAYFIKADEKFWGRVLIINLTIYPIFLLGCVGLFVFSSFQGLSLFGYGGIWFLIVCFLAEDNHQDIDLKRSKKNKKK